MNANPDTERVGLCAGRAIARRVIDHLRRDAAMPGGLELVMVGALRRGDETLDHVEVLALGSEAARARAARAFERDPDMDAVTERESSLIAGHLTDGLRVTLHLADPRSAGLALLHTTGPDAHVAAVEERLPAEAYRDEPALYAAIGKHWVPPEIRDLPDALARAEGRIRLIEVHDVRGALHCHTDWSDGSDTILEMARAAELMKLDYIAITDRSPSATHARGVGLDRLFRQWDAIAEAQERTPVRILRGTECDILADGSLDYPDYVLERFEVIIASVHNRHGQDEAAMTRRLLAALRFPLRKIWGHPLGRILLHRGPLECRFDEVLDAAAESGTIIELNGDPLRMDLGAAEARRAHARGLRFAVSCDAHAAGDLKNLHTAVTMARRTGLGPYDVVNTRGIDGFTALAHPTRSLRTAGSAPAPSTGIPL